MRCCGAQETEGFLNIDKPIGKTSFSVVARIRRWTGEKRIGHAGTLDPLATGVLPICIGQATRLVEYLVDATKTYRAEIEFGITTDTYDAEGKVLSHTDASGITQAQVEIALAGFRGEITQIPPVFSAVKQHGMPLYKLARAGVAVTPKKRTARIDRLELLDWQPPVATVEVVCGKGTYIRSLAHDLGEQLGVGAYLKNLERLRVGIFDIADAVTLEQLEEAFRAGYWENLLYPLDSILEHLPAVVLNNESVRAIGYGSAIPLEGFSAGAPVRAYDMCGKLDAILRYDSEKGLWHPEKVFVAGNVPPCLQSSPVDIREH
ncbi:MAG: tRNA pseudouridine(55) synthase TruB [Dehalococcoidia bacterium]|nr:tRNA pseudouridine(55) synthase TruB [Dehalococcoidia bacterium]